MKHPHQQNYMNKFQFYYLVMYLCIYLFFCCYDPSLILKNDYMNKREQRDKILGWEPTVLCASVKFESKCSWQANRQVEDLTSNDKTETFPHKQDHLSFWQVKWHLQQLYSFHLKLYLNKRDSVLLYTQS